jgi:predicted nucleic-acid-binding Zn-ribbon protein
MAAWEDRKCSKCGKRNWTNISDPTPGDYSGEDVDGFKCWNCGEVNYWEGNWEEWADLCGYTDKNEAYIDKGMKTPFYDEEDEED